MAGRSIGLFYASETVMFFIWKSGRPRGLLLLLIFFGIMLPMLESRPALLLFLVPVFFFWMFFAVLSFFTRSMARAASSLEDFWSDRLARPDNLSETGDDNTLTIPAESISPVEVEMPPSVSRNPRLSALWDRSIHLQRESALQVLPSKVRHQLHALADLFEHFQALLREKLRPDELTYHRFLNSGTQGYEMIVSELEQALNRMEQLQEVTISLKPTADDTAFNESTIRQIQQEQLQKIDSVLARTREAVAQMARVNLSVSEMHGQSARKEGDLTQAIDQLKDLAKRAERF